MAWGGYKPYVSVAERRQKARHQMDKLRKNGMNIQAVEIDGRKIARTFWGQSWCQHLESFSDYANRLPRGRTYVRNGSVCHLEITGGQIKAMVSGSELYEVKIQITQLPQNKWHTVKERCAGKIGSLLELLQGRLSSSVMTIVTDRREGLFPQPSEINLNCSCPDWATMCKHVAAVLYGVGARLDEKPELLFLLRGVDHQDLIEVDATSVIGSKQGGRQIAQSDLEDVFGIEILADDSLSPDKHITKPKKQAPEIQEPKKQVLKKQAPEIQKAADVMSKQKNGITSKTIKELRARLDMSVVQFALLIGVSPTSVSTWEKKRGRLNLQPRTMNALNTFAKLTKKQAWARLDITKR